MFIYHFNRLIRNRILWGFFAIVIAVAFVSVDSCFKSPQEGQTAGKLNGKKITESTFELAAQAVRGFGRNRDTQMPAHVADRRAWEQLAARQVAEADGLTSSKEEIQDMLREQTAFQGANGFDLNRYRMVLADQGLTPARYESLVGHQLALMKCSVLVETSTWVAPMELEDELAAMTDLFTVQFAAVSNRFAGVEMRLSDEDYRKYYEENKSSFALPDRISVRYIAFPVSNYVSRVSVSEDDLHTYYDDHVTSYTRTTSSNTTETIPFAEMRSKILGELTMEEARYCAATSVTFNIYGKLARAGSNALEIAAEQQKLPLKTSPFFGAEDTLYWVENSKEFADAAFELDPDRSDSRFGIVKGESFVYVIETVQRSPAHTPSYENVLNDIRPRAMAKARSEAFQSYAKELRADVRKLLDEGKSFAEAAKAKALNVSTSLTYTVSDMQNQKIENGFSLAYGAMGLKKGALSEVIPASANQSLLVFVQDRKPGDALAAEMMRAQIRSGVARRRYGSLFSDWLTWNLSQQEFSPTRPLESDDAEVGIESAADEDAPAKKAEEKKPAAKAAPAAKK